MNSNDLGETIETPSFTHLNLIEPLMRALKTEGYTTPTPIQILAVPHVLAGRDLLGWAQTGTGKTAAFALPVLQMLLQRTQDAGPQQAPAQAIGHRRPTPRGPRCLVLAPTRELAQQIGQSFSAYGKHTGMKSSVVFGGVGMMPQIDALRRGLDILVATPGRLLDLMNQGYASLSQLEILVLDEADRMLDMGFIHDIRKIMQRLPENRQTLLFSATMAPEIKQLAEGLLKNPVRVEVAPISSTAETITQALYFVDRKDKPSLLKHLIEHNSIDRALVFTRTKHMANRVSEYLNKMGITSDAFHSNKSQNARLRALGGFKQGQVRILVATDIAARGIDIDEISHVFNFDLPNEPEAYVHRIGRTGRAGASGQAVSFCSSDEFDFLTDIERTIRRHVPIVTEHPFSAHAPNRLRQTDLSGGRSGPRPQGGGGGRSQGGGDRSYGGRSHSQGGGNGGGGRSQQGNGRSQGSGTFGNPRPQQGNRPQSTGGITPAQPRAPRAPAANTPSASAGASKPAATTGGQTSEGRGFRPKVQPE